MVKKKQPAPVPIPYSYKQPIADEICDRISNGESLRSVCRDPRMPCTSTVCKWLSLNEGFAQQYAKARLAQADALFDEALDIADNASNDWMERNDPDNKGYAINGEAYQRSRLRIDTRKWVAGKLNPKKYGDKVLNEITGKEGGPIEVSDVTDAERVKALLAFIAEARAKKLVGPED